MERPQALLESEQELRCGLADRRRDVDGAEPVADLHVGVGVVPEGVVRDVCRVDRQAVEEDVAEEEADLLCLQESDTESKGSGSRW